MTTPSSLRLGPTTLGELVRATAAGRLEQRPTHTSFAYSERATTIPSDLESTALHIVDRRYHAEVEQDDDRLAADLQVTLGSGRVVALTLGAAEGRAWYQRPDEGHGELTSGCGRLSLEHYLERLELIPLTGSEVLTGDAVGDGPVRIEVWLSLEAFALLLTFTGADAPVSVNDMGFLSHRVELTRHHGNFELHCNWTMLGAEGDDPLGRQTRVRSSITVICGPGEGTPALEAPTGEPTLPAAATIEDVWRAVHADGE